MNSEIGCDLLERHTRITSTVDPHDINTELYVAER